MISPELFNMLLPARQFDGGKSWGFVNLGLTTARTYTRERRCTLKDKFRIV